MEDRQCKICLQHKPLEEFELFGTAGKRSFTCRDCKGLDAPVQPPEFRKLAAPKVIKVCCVDGCDEPCKHGYAKCEAHVREQWNAQRDAKPETLEKKQRDKKTICGHEGCNEPRYVAPGGGGSKFCREHYNEHQRELKAKKRAAKPLTEAQQHASFDRNPEKTIKGNDFKLCIIDYDKDTMIFVEGHVTRKCKTDVMALLPGGWQILLEGHAEDGYVVVERGTPPQFTGYQFPLWMEGLANVQ